ncbi:hypothetical protein BDR26DRAFT_886787 [Obelidium mucronatum]|nr:hypothetical protein BDR26DRAFT_886787 [Obelidium mucronatum]
MNQRKWFLLVDNRGEIEFDGVSAGSIFFGPKARVKVAHLRKSVWERYSLKGSILQGVLPAQLEVYSTKSDMIDPMKQPLCANDLVGIGGCCEEAPLFVLIPKIASAPSDSRLKVSITATAKNDVTEHLTKELSRILEEEFLITVTTCEYAGFEINLSGTVLQGLGDGSISDALECLELDILRICVNVVDVA